MNITMGARSTLIHPTNLLFQRNGPRRLVPTSSRIDCQGVCRVYTSPGDNVILLMHVNYNPVDSFA
jgi:hypothetical protein